MSLHGDLHESTSPSTSIEPEVTLEANPGTVDQERLEGFRAAGWTVSALWRRASTPINVEEPKPETKVKKPGLALLRLPLTKGSW